jgi:hypothetical protein
MLLKQHQSLRLSLLLIGQLPVGVAVAPVLLDFVSSAGTFSAPEDFMDSRENCESYSVFAVVPASSQVVSSLDSNLNFKDKFLSLATLFGVDFDASIESGSFLSSDIVDFVLSPVVDTVSHGIFGFGFEKAIFDNEDRDEMPPWRFSSITSSVIYDFIVDYGYGKLFSAVEFVDRIKAVPLVDFYFNRLVRKGRRSSEFYMRKDLEELLETGNLFSGQAFLQWNKKITWIIDPDTEEAEMLRQFILYAATVEALLPGKDTNYHS